MQLFICHRENIKSDTFGVLLNEILNNQKAKMLVLPKCKTKWIFIVIAQIAEW